MKWIAFVLLTGCGAAPVCEDAVWRDAKDLTGRPYVRSRRCTFEVCRSAVPIPNSACQ
jgi:hypothetical protein